MNFFSKLCGLFTVESSYGLSEERRDAIAKPFDKERMDEFFSIPDQPLEQEEKNKYFLVSAIEKISLRKSA